MTEQAPIIIVGTGLSGYSLAREIRKQDKETPVLMVTADDGVSYSKPMLSTGFTKGKDADGLAQGGTDAMAEQLNVRMRTFATVTGIDTGCPRTDSGGRAACLQQTGVGLGCGCDPPGPGR